MRLQRQSNKQIITLDLSSVVGQGGEARIYAVPNDESLVAKVYHKPQEAYAHKLMAMVANPPDNPMASQGKVSIAWPTDLLLTVDGNECIVGFLMPYVKGMHSVLEFYNPKTRRQKCPFFSYRYLHRTARNLAAAVGALHARGYCIGDMNESNILVSDTALVTLVDTDSFQVRELSSGEVYRCPVGKPEFTPPELQGKNFGQLDRIPQHDLFGLAVLIFQLLMEGTHPFSGIFRGTGDPPPYETRIRAGHFVYNRGRSVPYRSSPTAPPFEILHPTLQQLFVRCFEEGHEQPQMRPSAETWQSALKEAENSLVVCNTNGHHRYGNHLKTCPWCERALALGGRDPFPSTSTVKKKQHLQPIQPKKVRPLLRADFSSALARRRLNRQMPLFVRKPPKKKFNPFFLGLLGVAILGFLEVVVTVRTLNIPIDPSTTAKLEDSDVAASTLNNTSSTSVGYDERANAYYKLGDYEGAIDNFTRALRLNPNDTKAYMNRGNAYYGVAQNSGDPDKEYRLALTDFNQALRLDPKNAEAYFKRGLILYEIAQYSQDSDQDFRKAIDDFNQTLRLNPSNAEAYVKRGNARYKLAQFNGSDQGYKDAIEDFNKALNLDPQNAEAYIKRGLVRSEIARYSGNNNKDNWVAVEDLQKAAQIFLEQGDIEHYQQALGYICGVLENNCDSYLRNPEKFMLSGSQPIKKNGSRGK
ncbi:MAG: tetratricopeptide repeat protein [Chroococcidiopsidaceae cyanobacterium CP_BM_ER_R8_30]|nr:tetratricopeptide repeat protein [Chroococcidiopsidaceae cyanobacterium CP_BM_ER_R8_30]